MDAHAALGEGSGACGRNTLLKNLGRSCLVTGQAGGLALIPSVQDGLKKKATEGRKESRSARWLLCVSVGISLPPGCHSSPFPAFQIKKERSALASNTPVITVFCQPGAVAHIYNPGYQGGRDRRICSSRPSWEGGSKTLPQRTNWLWCTYL
jgi:hypothetical protein